jgi:hypothetical protein
MTSLSFKISKSSSSILTSVPDYLPNSTRITFFQLERDDFVVVVADTRPDSNNFALLGFFFHSVKDDDAVGCSFAALTRRITTRSFKGRNFMLYLR